MLGIAHGENADWLQYLHSFNLTRKYLYIYVILPVVLYVDYGFLMQNGQIGALELTVGSSFMLLSTSLNSSSISNDSTMTLEGLNALCTLSDQYGLSNSFFSWNSYLRDSLTNVNLALENKAEYG